MLTLAERASHQLLLEWFAPITESQNHRITESQNHRMLGVGRDLPRISSVFLTERAVRPIISCRHVLSLGTKKNSISGEKPIRKHKS